MKNCIQCMCKYLMFDMMCVVDWRARQSTAREREGKRNKTKNRIGIPFDMVNIMASCECINVSSWQFYELNYCVILYGCSGRLIQPATIATTTIDKQSILMNWLKTPWMKTNPICDFSSNIRKIFYWHVYFRIRCRYEHF